MPFRLREVITDERFAEMIPGFFQAMHTPRNVMRMLLFPIHIHGPKATEAEVDTAMEDCKNRSLAIWHDCQKFSHVLQIIDSDNGDEVVGAAVWLCFDAENNPYPEVLERYLMTKLNVNWWQEDSEGQNVAHRSIIRHLLNKSEIQTRPHLDLIMCYTTPHYRRQGVASMLLDWGTKKADQLGFECFLNAVEGVTLPLFKKFGFVPFYFQEEYLDCSLSEDKWNEMQEHYTPAYCINMWRLIGGENKYDWYPWDE